MKTAKLSFDHVIAGRTFTFDASVLPGSPGGNLDPPEPGEVNYLDVHEGDTPIGWDAFEAMLPSLVGEDGVEAAIQSIDFSAFEAEESQRFWWVE